jgi:hypothetical protein
LPPPLLSPDGHAGMERLPPPAFIPTPPHRSPVCLLAPLADAQLAAQFAAVPTHQWGSVIPGSIGWPTEEDLALRAAYAETRDRGTRCVPVQGRARVTFVLWCVRVVRGWWGVGVLGSRVARQRRFCVHCVLSTPPRQGIPPPVASTPPPPSTFISSHTPMQGLPPHRLWWLSTRRAARSTLAASRSVRGTTGGGPPSVSSPAKAAPKTTSPSAHAGTKLGPGGSPVVAVVVGAGAVAGAGAGAGAVAVAVVGAAPPPPPPSRLRSTSPRPSPTKAGAVGKAGGAHKAAPALGSSPLTQGSAARDSPHAADRAADGGSGGVGGGSGEHSGTAAVAASVQRTASAPK